MTNNKCQCIKCMSSKVNNVTEPFYPHITMSTCVDCGNKRCPKATNHSNICTNSNKPNQKGSAYKCEYNEETETNKHERNVMFHYFSKANTQAGVVKTLNIIGFPRDTARAFANSQSMKILIDQSSRDPNLNEKQKVIQCTVGYLTNLMQRHLDKPHEDINQLMSAIAGLSKNLTPTKNLKANEINKTIISNIGIMNQTALSILKNDDF
jgi:hypothetical protein